MFVFGEVYPEKVSTDSIIYPLWCYYRGRMVAHAVLENNILAGEMHKEAKHYLECAAKHFGEDGIMGMYLGKGIEWPDSEVTVPGAPLWASEQVKASAKLRDVANFWVRERQLENGEYGGGTNDDVELWRQLKLLITGFEDDETFNATKKLAQYIFSMVRIGKNLKQQPGR
jgi:hypothetical protein